MSELPLNFAYLKTKLGVLKVISVVTGLLAVALTAAAYDTAHYYNYKCTSPLERGKGPGQGRIQKGMLGSLLQDATSCEQLMDGAFQNCEFYVDKLKGFKSNRKTAREYLKKSRENRANNFHRFGVRYRDLEIVDDIPKSCPYPWLVALPVYLIGFLWATSFVMLIIQIVVDLNENSKFVKIDLILHSVYAGVMLISASLLTAFIIWALIENYPCTQRLYDNQEKVGPVFSYMDKVGMNPSGVGGYPGAPIGRSKSTNQEEETNRMSRVDEENLYKNCLDETNGTYKLWLLIGGLVFAAVTLIMYGIMVVILIKENLKEPSAKDSDDKPQGSGDQQEQQNLSHVSSVSSIPSTQPSS